MEGRKTMPAAFFGIDWDAILRHVGPCPGNNRNLWHIDHIRPLSSFDFDDPAEIQKAFAPENHQWLPAVENLRKGAKWQTTENSH